jgi:hypothetical protein
LQFGPPQMEYESKDGDFSQFTNQDDFKSRLIILQDLYQ